MALIGGDIVATLAARLTADTSDFNASIDEATAKLEESKAAMDSGSGSAKSYGSAVDSTRSPLDNLTKSSNSLNSSLKNQSDNLKNVKGPATDLQRAFAAMKTEIDNSVLSQNNMRSALANVTTEMRGQTSAGTQLRSVLRDSGLAASDADAAFSKLAATLSKDALNKALGSGGGSGGINASDLLGGAAEGGLGGGDSGPGLAEVANFFGTSPIVLVLAAAIGALTLAFAPFLTELAGGIVILTGFTAGLIGLLAVAGGGALVLGGIGAAIVALAANSNGWASATAAVSTAQGNVTSAEKAHQTALAALAKAQDVVSSATKPTTTELANLSAAEAKAKSTGDALTQAQNNLTDATAKAKNPLTDLENAVKGMVTSWGQLATGPATQILQWLTNLVPLVQQAGDAIITWFGGNLPGILSGFSKIIGDLDKSLTTLGNYIGGTFSNEWVTMMAVAQPIFQQLASVGTQVVISLLQDFMKLATWFVENWPTVGPIVGQVLSNIGGFVNWLLTQFDNLYNWFVQNWPKITSFVQQFYDAINNGFQTILTFTNWLLNATGAGNVLQLALKYIGDHLNDLKPILIAVGVILGAIILVFLALGTAIVVLAAAFTWLWAQISNGVNQDKQIFETLANYIENRFNLVRTGLLDIWNGIRSDLSSVWNSISSQVKNSVNQVINDINKIINGIDSLNIPGVKLPIISGMGGGSGSGAGAGRGAGGGSRIAGLGAGGTAATPNVSNLSSLVGTIGGQCLAWLNSIGFNHYLPAAIDLLPDVNSHTASAGEVFVMNIGQYGHTGLVLGDAVGGQVPVIDSNWSLNEVVQEHTIPASEIAGYISGSFGSAGLPSVAGLAASIDPASSIASLIQGIGSVTGFPGALMMPGLLNMLKGGLTSDISKILGIVPSTVGSQKGSGVGLYDNGGTLYPGAFAYNASGKPETVRSADQEAQLGNKIDAMHETMKRKLMGSVTINGASQKSTAAILDDIQFQTFATSL